VQLILLLYPLLHYRFSSSQFHMHPLASALLAAVLLSATSFSAPSDDSALVKRDYTLTPQVQYQPPQHSPQPQQFLTPFGHWDNGKCGRDRYLRDGQTYVFMLEPWGDDRERRILAGCWACFGNSGQAGQGWRGTAGAVMRDTLQNVQWYNKWKVSIPNPNDNIISLSITGDGQTMFLGAGSPMRLSNNDNRAYAVTNDVHQVRLRYYLTKNCKIRITDEHKGVLGRCGNACRDWKNVVSLHSGTEVMHFWGNYNENNQYDRPLRVDYTAIPY